MMRSRLLSTLRQQYASRGLDAFRRAEPHHWLLWEPGAWRPPQKQTMPIPASVAESPPPSGAEALAIVVQDLGRPLVLGREAGCDLYLNDGTLSGRHLTLTPGAQGWKVEDLGSTNGTRLNEVALAPGAAAALADGSRLEAGQVVLTFYAPEGLWPRFATP